MYKPKRGLKRRSLQAAGPSRTIVEAAKYLTANTRAYGYTSLIHQRPLSVMPELKQSDMSHLSYCFLKKQSVFSCSCEEVQVAEGTCRVMNRQTRRYTGMALASK